MTVWVWIGVAVGAFIALSLLVGLGIARILGMIGEEVASIQEAEPWASAPLARETDEPAESEPSDTRTEQPADNQRSRSSHD